MDTREPLPTPHARHFANAASALILAVALFPSCSSESMAQERSYAYAFPHDGTDEHARWIHALGEPDLASIDLRQSEPFPTTRLLLPFDALVDQSTVDATDGTVLPCAGASVPGARAGAVALERPLTYEFSEDLPDEWSLFLWVRSDGSAGDVLDVDGHVSAKLDPDGILWVEASSGAARVPLESGWNWVGIASERLAGTRLRISTANGIHRLNLPPADERTRRGVLTLGTGIALDDVRFEHAALSTHAFERLVDPPRPGGTERVRIAVREGSTTRYVERWRARATTPTLEGAELATGARSHWLASEEGFAWTPGQWRQQNPDQGPKPRTTHPTLSVGPGKIWIFGGEVIDSYGGPYTNDAQAWSYDLASQSWTLEAADGTGPSARCHLSAGANAAGDEVLIVGGWCNASDIPHDVFGDVWSLDRTTGEWTQWDVPDKLNASDQPLVAVPELDGCLYFLRHNVVLFRFADKGHRVLPKAQILDLDGNPTDKISGFSFAHVYDAPRKRILLFGGQVMTEGTSTFHSQLYAYEIEANVFRQLGDGGPPGRVRPGFARDEKRDRVVMFGGVHEHDSERFDDLWVLDPETAKWSERTAADTPSARGGYFHMAYDAPSDQFALLLGRHSYNNFLDEVWLLTLEDGATAEAEWAFQEDALGGAETAFVEGRWSDEDEVEVSVERVADEADGTPLVHLSVRAKAADHAAPPTVVRVGFGAAGDRPADGLRRATVPLD